jgi:hypothetical protein
MISFLVALVFAPVLSGFTWMYMSPLPRLDGLTPVKVIIRIVLFVATLGGIFAQLNFLAHNEPLSARNFYGTALLGIEAVPILSILIYRYNRDPPRS